MPAASATAVFVRPASSRRCWRASPAERSAASAARSAATWSFVRIGELKHLRLAVAYLRGWWCRHVAVRWGALGCAIVERLLDCASRGPDTGFAGRLFGRTDWACSTVGIAAT